MRRSHARYAMVGALAWCVLALPPVQHALTATMTRQMLVQIPLLVAAGWLLAQALPRSLARRFAPWNRGGITGVLLASFVALGWMLPRALDAAAVEPAIAALKFASVPLLIGVPMALSWPRAGFVLRGVLLLELIASAFRFGWLYLATPERLCNNYLLNDQQWLGWMLIALGGAGALALAAWALFGRTAARVSHA